MFRAPARGTFACGGKSTQKRHLNLRFKNPPALSPVKNLRPFTARSRNMVIVVVVRRIDFPLAPLPLMLLTVEPKALFGAGISGSGDGAETIR